MRVGIKGVKEGVFLRLCTWQCEGGDMWEETWGELSRLGSWGAVSRGQTKPGFTGLSEGWRLHCTCVWKPLEGLEQRQWHNLIWLTGHSGHCEVITLQREKGRPGEGDSSKKADSSQVRHKPHGFHTSQTHHKARGSHCTFKLGWGKWVPPSPRLHGNMSRDFRGDSHGHFPPLFHLCSPRLDSLTGGAEQVFPPGATPSFMSVLRPTRLLVWSTVLRGKGVLPSGESQKPLGIDQLHSLWVGSFAEFGGEGRTHWQAYCGCLTKPRPPIEIWKKILIAFGVTSGFLLHGWDFISNGTVTLISICLT